MIAEDKKYIKKLSDNCRKLSQLPDIPTENFISSDEFLLSRFDQESWNNFLETMAAEIASGNIRPKDGYKIISDVMRYSVKTRYDVLSAQLLNDISANLGLSSMAYENKYDYSRIGHQHGYSNVYGKAESGVSALAAITTRDIWGNELSINIAAPEFRQPTYKPYVIGEVRLLARNNYYCKKYTDDDFDGWVYADGSKYPISLFPTAAKIYADMPGNTNSMFAVPVISDFILPTAPADNVQPLSVLQWSQSLESHTHPDLDTTQINKADYESNVTFSLDCYYTGYASNGSRSIHTGYTKHSGSINYQVDLDLNGLSTLASKTNSMDVTMTEPYPEHLRMPVMVYIGIPGVTA